MIPILESSVQEVVFESELKAVLKMTSVELTVN